MKTLGISSSLKIAAVSRKHDGCFKIGRGVLPVVTTGQWNATVNSGIVPNSLISLQKRRIDALLPISSSSSRFSYEAQINDLVDDEIRDRDLGKVNVRFQLQRECWYGEQFYLVGDDPMLGSWNPENAVTLEWSEGHVWAASLDMAIGKTFQYKFFLKSDCMEDHLTWMPGSDRVLTTWETTKRIVVCEDWDDVLIQKIIEEDVEPKEETIHMPKEDKISSNGAAPVPVPIEEEILKEAAAMEDVISISSSYGSKIMVEEEPEVTTA